MAKGIKAGARYVGEDVDIVRQLGLRKPPEGILTNYYMAKGITLSYPPSRARLFKRHEGPPT